MRLAFPAVRFYLPHRHMKNRFLYGILVAALSLNLLAGFQIYVYSAGAEGRDDPEASLALLTQVMELIRQDYVDSDKVSYENLINEALRGMVGTWTRIVNSCRRGSLKNSRTTPRGSLAAWESW